jgi:succinoglycan biosynthesis protein ExoO
MPEASIIIPAWRAARCIGAAIASARAQTLVDIEIIVVDDASPDDTYEAAWKAGEDDPRVKILRQSVNSGPAAARNVALEYATGQWIAVLDADDTMEPTRLRTLIDFAAREQADIVADDLQLVKDGISAGRHLALAEPCKVDLATYARSNVMFSGAAQLGYLKPVFRAAFLAQHSLRYDPAVRIGEDYLLVASALALGARFALHADALYRYTIGGESISRRLSRPDVNMLIQADDRYMARFAADVTPAARAALAHRRASLEDAGAFIDAVEAIKAHDFSAGFAAALRRPASLRHFAMPVRARLARLSSGNKTGAQKRSGA